MGYPVITRLGINQFWYRHWFSVKNFKKNSKQDRLFLDLLKLYLDYGLSFSNFIFFNSYFFGNKFKRFKYNMPIYNLKFFRRYFFSNEPLGIEHSYLLRYKTGEYFPIRLWLVRYSKWVMLFFSCFKPVKSKGKHSYAKKKELHSVSTSLKWNIDFFNIRRFILGYLFFKGKYVKNLCYGF